MGSLERFFGTLIEHYSGAFPVWLAPDQVIILPITDNQNDYGFELAQKLKDSKIRAKVDDRNEKIGFKIREAEIQKIPYMLIVGEKEASSKTISIRKRKEGDLGKGSLDEFIEKIKSEIDKKV